MKTLFFFTLLGILLVVGLAEVVACTSPQTTPTSDYPYPSGGTLGPGRMI